MIGYPKTLQTKEDYEYVRANFPKEAWKQDFQNLLDTQKEWYVTGELESEDAGVNDETHRVIPLQEEGENGERVTKYAQQELKYNEKCKLAQLGYTAQEVEGYLAE